MSSLSSLLILAALAAPASEDRHADAQEIFSCNFDESWDVNYDSWPDKWFRQYGPGWPHYVKVGIEEDEQAEAGRCLKVRLDGGGALVTSPEIWVSDRFSYVLQAKLRNVELQHARARVRLDFCDAEKQVLDSSASDWYANTKDWAKIEIGPVNVTDPNVRLAKVTLEVDGGERTDLHGQISLDDIWLARQPRMTVRTGRPFNVYTDPNDVIVFCDLSGISEVDPKIRFELLDARSRLIADKVEQLDGRLIARQQSKTSDRSGPASALPPGYEGSAKWRPPIHEHGFYRVDVTKHSKRGVPMTQTISIAVVPPSENQRRGEFGWSLAGDDIPLSLEQLGMLLPQVAVSRVKYPVWYGLSEPERGDELIQFTEKLSAEDIEVIGVIDSPPADLELDREINSDTTIADLMSEDSSAWLPSLDAVLTRLSLRVRWWQLGTDQDTSFSHFYRLEKEMEKLRNQLFRFGQDVSLGIGWPWNESTESDELASWDFQQYSATPSLTGDELASYLQLPRRRGVDKWVMIEPLPRDGYELNTRSRDLVEQMLAAKIHNADGIFVAHPFDDERGVMSDAGTPGELLLPWRTTASLLSGTKFLGSLRLPGGSENRLFETAEGDVLMVVWNQKPTSEVIYLGENVRVHDVWGRTESPPQQEHRQVIEVSSLPKFVLGLNPDVAKLRMSIRFHSLTIPSVFGTAHPNRITIENHTRQGIGGSVKVNTPEDWQITPEKIDYKLAAGDASYHPFQIELPSDANGGSGPIRIDVEFTAERNYQFSVYRELTVGDGEIVLEVNTLLNRLGELIVEQRMVNHGNTLADFRCQLVAVDRRLQRMQVFQLGSSPDVKIYRYPNGRELIGTELRLSAEERGSNRVLNHRFTAER